MSKRNVIPLLILVGVALLALAVACGGGAEEPSAPPPAEESVGDLGGAELLEARCTRCHNLDRVKAASKTLDEWTTTVERMRGKGADLADAEAEILSDYLAETYGP